MYAKHASGATVDRNGVEAHQLALADTSEALVTEFYLRRPSMITSGSPAKPQIARALLRLLLRSSVANCQLGRRAEGVSKPGASAGTQGDKDVEQERSPDRMLRA